MDSRDQGRTRAAPGALKFEAMAGDHDIMRDEHMVAIYHHLPNRKWQSFQSNGSRIRPVEQRGSAQKRLPLQACKFSRWRDRAVW